jgi:hypothetical protein
LAVGLVDVKAAKLWPLDVVSGRAVGDVNDIIRTFDDLRGRLEPMGPGIPLNSVRLAAPILPSLIETLSAGLTLQPGDIIATGTPAGVGVGFTPPRFLRPGDHVAIEISGIGRLENPIV